jgi:hypothetical protein
MLFFSFSDEHVFAAGAVAAELGASVAPGAWQKTEAEAHRAREHLSAGWVRDVVEAHVLDVDVDEREVESLFQLLHLSQPKLRHHGQRQGVQRDGAATIGVI